MTRVAVREAVAVEPACRRMSCGEITPLVEKLSPSLVCPCRRLRKVEELPPEDQKALLTMVDALLEQRAIKQAC
ncbi:MAG TPA: hypothetical protein VE913_23905 [Longimicrobium sp.]|nr:hypothetical protein [Longimicrobium sp.]